MSPARKNSYFLTLAHRYHESTREQKTEILKEFCANTGYHPKHAIRKLNTLKPTHRPKKPPRKRGPKSKYDKPEVLKPLQQIWLTANLPCSKRLKAILPEWISHYQSEFGFLTTKTLGLLESISPATMDRVLKPFRINFTGLKGRSSTKPGLLLKHHIPIKTNQWDESKPGFLEADTVAHCGISLAGDFVYTLDTTDIATGWTEQRAIWGKGEIDVVKQLQDIESCIPFHLLGFDCDNGSEFLNWHLIRHFQNRKQPIQVTRSRPYHKDDNAHIEQKNWTHVRQWLGYSRFENPKIVPRSTSSTATNGGSFSTSSCLPQNLLRKNGSAQRSSNATTIRSPLAEEHLLHRSSLTQQKICSKNLRRTSTPLNSGK